MPVEIRELIIKTEISIGGRNNTAGIREEAFQSLKKQVLEECKKIITDRIKKNNDKR